jgi:hypothetical protein
MRSILMIVGASALCLSASAATAQLLGGGLVGSMRGVGGYVDRSMAAAGGAETAAAQGEAYGARSHRTRGTRRGHRPVAASRSEVTRREGGAGRGDAGAESAGEQAAEAR